MFSEVNTPKIIQREGEREIEVRLVSHVVNFHIVADKIGDYRVVQRSAQELTNEMKGEQHYCETAGLLTARPLLDHRTVLGKTN
jgi:hypothetical protein